MAGRQLNHQGVRTTTNWVAVCAATLAVVMIAVGVFAYVDKNWFAMAGAGLLGLAGICLAVVSTNDDGV